MSTHMMVELVGYIGSILVLINLYYLIRLRKSDRNYDFIEGEPGESLVQYMINFITQISRNTFQSLKRNSRSAILHM